MKSIDRAPAATTAAASTAAAAAATAAAVVTIDFEILLYGPYT